MSLNRSERRQQNGYDVADFLDAIDERKRANDIRALCRTLAMSRATSRSLHRELMMLRGKK